MNQNIYESKENYLRKEMLFSPTDFEGHLSVQFSNPIASFLMDT